MAIRVKSAALFAAAIMALAFSPIAVAPAAQAAAADRFAGGPRGAVKNEAGVALEGIMIQLVSDKSHMRTTVYSNADGRYEFPRLEPGTYTLRIARPREFQPFLRQAVEVRDRAQFDDIVLKRVTPLELLPPAKEIMAQMTGTEWLMSLAGTGEEKRLLTLNCNFCHSYQQIFRNRYDEAGWTQIVRRMTHGAGSPLILMRPVGRFNDALEAKLVHWLATVRGPQSEDPSFVTLPRPQGRATRAVVTEYELPRLELATHDVSGDGQGNIWYSTHRSSYVGKLDSKTGKVTEFRVPNVDEGALPGTHWIHVDKNGIVWGSENWAHNIWRLDPKTDQFSRVHWNVSEPINAPMGGNYSLDPAGFIWRTRGGNVSKIDATTGEVVENHPTKKFPSTYGSAMSADGRYFGGGAWPRDGVVVYDTQTGELYEPDASPGAGPARGEFDPFGNYWAGGRGGLLVEFDIQRKKLVEYRIPTQHTALYTAHPDKNGEVWAGESHSGQYLRFNPKTGVWTEYMLPEPYGFDREAWIDNSTNPVTVWYVDHDGWITRIEPME